MIHYIQKKKRKFVFSYWYLIFLFHFLFSINASAQTINKDYLDGHIYLKIRNDITINIPSIGEKVNLKDAFFLNDIKKQYQLIRLEKPFFAAKSAALQHTFRLEFSDFENVDKIIEALYKTKIIEYAEKVPLEKFYYTPNDPMYNSGTQWFLNKINAPNAWNLSKGSSQISVAIVDGGVLLTHPDLKANIWINPKEIPNNKIDDDKNGYVDDVNGYDVSDNDADPTNGYGAPHGTHCAGLASAVTDNNSGIASIGFGIKIMAVKVSKNATPTQPFNSPNGVLYAIEAGARVISISLGGVTYSATYQNIFNYAHDRGVVVVAAAGNDNTNAKHYPGAYNHVICIGATDQNDKRASFSDYGTWVDVMAPGVAMNSTVPTESNPTGFGLFDGTSMACPLTAGLCGLMLSVFPDATPEQVESCLKSSAINVDNLNSGYAGQLGAGRIDASAALQCMGLLSKMTPTAAFTANNTTTCPGATIYFSDQSTFKPGSWLWDFGDGTTSSLQNPTHTYASQGTYTVKLTATNSNGPGVATKTNYITVGAGVPNSNTQKTGPADSTKGNGRGFSSAGLRAMYFKVDKELTLKSIRVYTGDTAGNRRFVIIDTALLSAFSITEYYDTTINLPANKDLRINFNNWHLNPGTYCLLLDIARNGLVQNLLRTTGGISYPQAIPGVISIFSNWFALNNNSTPQEWYVGYDWEILVNECVTSVGLPEISLIQNLNIYPNPGNGHFTITFNAPEKSDYLIEIRNVLGQVISNEKLLDIAGEYNRELDLSQLGKGIYFFTLKSGYNHTIQKLIIE